MSLEKTASAIARAIFDRIERDGNIVLANLEEAALSVLAVEAERRKATMTELSPFKRNPSLDDMERQLVEVTRREKARQDRERADFIKQHMIEPGLIANTLRDYAIKQGLVPQFRGARMTNVAGADDAERAKNATAAVLEMERSVAETYKLRPSDPTDRCVPVIPQEVLAAQARMASAGAHGLASTMVVVDDPCITGIDYAGPNSDSVKMWAKQPDGSIHEIRAADVARDRRASS